MSRRTGFEVVWTAAGIVAAAAFLSASPCARAATYTWQAPSGDWSVPSNWGGTLPSGNGSAYIANGGTATITRLGETCGTLSLGSSAGSGAVQMTGGSLSASNYEYVGYSGSGTFTQSGGTNAVAGNLFLGYGAGSSGIYNLDGGVLLTPVITAGSGSSTFNFSGGTLRAAASNVSFLSGVTAVYDQAGGAVIDSQGFNDSIAQPLLHDPSLGPAADGGLTKLGTGTLLLAASNTYTGATSVVNGTLVATNPLALQNSTVNISQNGTLSFGLLASATLGGLAGPGIAEMGVTYGTATAVTVGSNNANTTFSGSISGSGSLTKIGTGELTLGGPTSSAGQYFYDAVIVSGGTLQLNGRYIPPGENTGTPQLDRSPSIAVNAGSVLALNAADVLGWIYGYNALTINGGTVANITPSGRVTFNNPLTMTGGLLTGSGSGDGNGCYSFLPNGFVATSDAYGNPAVVNAQSIALEEGNLVFDVTRGPMSPASDLIIGSAISEFQAEDLPNQSWGINKTGNGIMTLLGANVYTGATSISAGTLVLGNPLALQNSTLDTSGGGALSFGTLTAATFGGLTGPGSLTLISTASSGGVALSVENNNASTTYSGSLTGPGSLIKIGSGTTVFTGNNSYSGTTTINQGELMVNGSLVSPVTVNSGGILAGTGSLTSVTVNPGGQFLPGDAPGILQISGSLSLVGGSVLDYELDTPLGSSEVLMPGGTLVLGGQQFCDCNFTPLAGFGPGTYTLIEAGSLSGNLGTDVSGTIDGYQANLAIQGDNLVLNVSTAVPEPSTLALLAAAGVGIFWTVFRRRRRGS